MSKPIQISIPKPCHENWESMTPVEKGRFCESCQQKVYDFTNSSDREIINILKSEKGACGRFRSDQLERNLITYKENANFWKAATIAFLSAIGLSSHKAIAQKTVKTEIHESDTIKTATKNDTIKSVQNDTITIKGVVKDKSYSLPLPGAMIKNLNSQNDTQADIDGRFSITAQKGDTLEISFIGYETLPIMVEEPTTDLEATLRVAFMGLPVRERTFFGKIFHSIGNWFR